MHICLPRQLGRALSAGAVVAVLALAGCSADVKGPTEQEARDAGQQYGEAIVDKIGSRATLEEMEELCGARAMEEGYVTKGREGDETDLELDAFIDGCRNVVKEQ